MHRFLAALLVVVGMSLTQPPAGAATISVSLTATRTTVLEGQRVGLSGQVIGAIPGSTIKLQQYTAAGWQTINSRRVWDTGRFGFSVLPARGYQRYRVVKAIYRGQPRIVSPVVILKVEWQPVLSTTATPERTADGDHVTYAGTVSGAPSATVRLQRRYRSTGTWYDADSVAAGPDGGFSFLVLRDYADAQFRIVVPRSGLRREVVSAAMPFDHLPWDLTLNEPLEITGLLPAAHAAVVHFDATEGTEVSIAALAEGDFTAHVVAPDGSLLDTFTNQTSSRLARFVAPQSGQYTVDVGVDYFGYLRLWGTTTLVVPVAVGEPTPSVSPLPGQLVEYTLTGSAEQLIGIDDFSWSARLLDPARAPVVPLVTVRRNPHFADMTIFRLPTSGAYTFRIDSGFWPDKFHVSPVTVANAAIGQPDFTVDVPAGAVRLVQFPVAPGQVFSSWVEGGTYARYGPDWEDPVNGVGGSHTLALIGGPDPATMTVELNAPMTIDVVVDGPTVPVDATGDFRRPIVLRFAGTAGQVIRFDETTASGFVAVHTMTGPQGESIPRMSFGTGAWELPADGTYELIGHVADDYVGTMGLSSLEQMTLAFDGTPTVVPVDEPGERVAVRVDAPVGALVDLTLAGFSPSLADRYSVDAYSPGGYWYNSFRSGLTPPATLPRFVVRTTDHFWVFVGAYPEGTGTITLEARPPAS